VSSNQRDESYLNIAFLCPHLADVIVDWVEVITHHGYGHTSQQGPFCLRWFLKGIFDMIAAHI